MKGHSGFTVIELMVALVAGALVVAGAHRVFTGIVDGLQRNARAQSTLNREANARRLLAAVVSSIETGGSPDQGFQGEPHRVAFSAWCRDAGGRAVKQRISIMARDGMLLLHGVHPEPTPLLRGVTALSFDYLLEPGANERFVQEWRSDASAPLAIRVRVGRGEATDTLLLIVGGRG